MLFCNFTARLENYLFGDDVGISWDDVGIVPYDIAQQRFFVLNTNSYKIKIITAVIKIFQSKPFSFGKIIIRYYLTK